MRVVLGIVSFVLVGHLRQAAIAALLFLAGGLVALPVVACRLERLTWLAGVLFRMVGGLLGKRPGLGRLWGVIFVFNGTAMLLYMAAGVHPILPAAISFLTGYHIGVILLKAGQAGEWDRLPRSRAHGWIPGRRIAGICGVAVLLLELPCFWYAIGMGLRLGQEIASGRVSYLHGLGPRLEAYGLVILPLLLVSALCEAIAIKGLQAPLPGQTGLPADGERGSAEGGG